MFSLHKPLIFAAALTLPCPFVKASETQPDQANDLPVTESYVDAAHKTKLQISDKSREKFGELSNLFEVAVNQQQASNGLPEDEALAFPGLLRIVLAKDVKQAELTQEDHDRMLAMSPEEFNRFCLDHNIYIRFFRIKSEISGRYFLAETTLAEISKSEKLSESIKDIMREQKGKFTAEGFRYPDFKSPVVYLKSKELISDGSCVAATIIETPGQGAEIVFDPSPIMKVMQNWSKPAKRDLIDSTLANELAHIRNQALFNGKLSTEKLDVSLNNKKIQVLWVECDEAISDLASILQAEDNTVIAFFLMQSLLDRSGTYRLSDLIQKEAAINTFGQETVNDLLVLADQFNKTRQAADFGHLQSKTEEAVRKKPEFRKNLISLYCQTLSDLR